MNVQEQFEITWRDGHREPSCAPNPAYPAGVDLDISKGAQTTCKVALPYPAKRIGGYVIECHRCGIGVGAVEVFGTESAASFRFSGPLGEVRVLLAPAAFFVLQHTFAKGPS